GLGLRDRPVCRSRPKSRLSRNKARPPDQAGVRHNADLAEMVYCANISCFLWYGRGAVRSTRDWTPKELPMARQQSAAMTEKLKLLSETGRDTEMGRLLRLFWQPVAISHGVKSGQAKPLRVMGEDLTLYRGAHDKPPHLTTHSPHPLPLL